ncbi:hypothetical protein [Nonomuraea sp. NPDC049709]|uniref:hypothetical protein n=1 Tax=Nonomuraea sp. NPDC049709 TaxID=3154736 RepID=UPI0034469438
MTSDDPGFLQARLDAFGPFVELRWGQRWVLRVRAAAWVAFADAVHRGRYVPERVRVRPEWVRVRIEERFDAVAPVGWQPKVFEVPNLVWERFVNGVRAGAFAELAVLVWSGVPAEALRGPVNGQAEAALSAETITNEALTSENADHGPLAGQPGQHGAA